MDKIIARWSSIPLFLLAIAFIHLDIPDLLISLILAITAQLLLMYGTEYL